MIIFKIEAPFLELLSSLVSIFHEMPSELAATLEGLLIRTSRTLIEARFPKTSVINEDALHK